MEDMPNVSNPLLEKLHKINPNIEQNHLDLYYFWVDRLDHIDKEIIWVNRSPSPTDHDRLAKLGVLNYLINIKDNVTVLGKLIAQAQVSND